MSFDISTFKSTIQKYGGPAKTSLFTVELDSLEENSFIEGRDLLFFCKNVTLPGLNLQTATYRQNTIDIPQAIPIALEAEPLNCVFMLDSSHRVLSFFHSWMQKIVNYSTQAGQFSSIDDQLPYELGYKNEYKCRMTIRYYSTNATSRENNYYQVILDGVYPKTVQSIDLAWENNDSFATLPVAFSYDRIQYSAETAGVPSERNTLEDGLLDLISTVGQVGDIFGVDLIPDSVQDAIDTYTKVTDAVDSLLDIF